MAQACAARYRARNPRATPLYGLFEAHFDEVRGQWEERYEGRYGFWRGCVDKQVLDRCQIGARRNFLNVVVGVPRGQREMIEGGLYHVYNRFARGEEVFGDPQEAVSFVDRLHEVKARDGFVVLAWCLMSNHFHMALRTSVVPLSRTMHYLQNGFSREFNRRWRRTGPLWQSRYKARLIKEEGYLVRLIMYIHLNPVRGGLTEQPAAYTFSGHRELIGKICSPLCDVDEALLAFGQSTKSARRGYVSVLKQAMGEDGLGDVVDNLPWWTGDWELEVDSERSTIDFLGRSTGLERQDLDDLDRALSELAIERLAEIRAAERKS